jgi:hypothetical protein
MANQSPPAQDEPAPRPKRVRDVEFRCWIEARVDWRGDNGQFVKQRHRRIGAQLTFEDIQRERGAA